MKFPKGIEGDYLETNEGLIFDIKGLLHPNDRKICFIRFYPDQNGDRTRNNLKYKKIYDLEERYTFLRKNFPEYLFYSKQNDLELQGVEISKIKNIYTPRSHLKKLQSNKKLSKIDTQSIELCNLLIKEGNLNFYNIGITGSTMVGLNKKTSDIDLVLYGTEISHKFQNNLQRLFSSKKDNFRKYNKSEFKKHYKFRASGSGIGFNEFLRSEKMKLHQGKFKNTDFYIRYLKSPEDWKGTYNDFIYENLGRISLKAKIINSKDSIFTPSTYKINVLKLYPSQNSFKNSKLNEITEINSYRGRFCEHAEKNDLVFVEGKLEKVNFKDSETYYRVLLGNKPNDKMIKLIN
ncbi:MAG: hypothetical protein P8Y70_07690 [Candidatus Lokiarchaeota archaeon]